MLFSVLCVSDRCSRGECADNSGPVIISRLEKLGSCAAYMTVPDEIPDIAGALVSMADEKNSDIIITTGGTGFAPRDVTPEATGRVIEKAVPGIPEAIRAESMKITPKAMLSRATAGIRGKCLIINLPGSPKAVAESLDVIMPVLPHALETLSGQTQSCGGNYGK